MSDAVEQQMMERMFIGQGMSPEDARKQAMAVMTASDDDEVLRMVRQYKAVGEAIQAVPAQAQPAVAMALTSEMGSKRSRGGGSGLAERVIEMKETERILDRYFGKGAGGQTAEEASLQKQLAAMQEELAKFTKKEQEDALNKKFEELNAGIKSVQEQIIAVKQGGGGTTDGDMLDRLNADMEQAVGKMNTMRKWIGLPPIDAKVLAPPDAEIDETAAVSKLKSKGYRIENPPTFEDWERRNDEKLKAIKDETEKKIREEMKIEEKARQRREEKEDMALTLGVSVIDGIFSTIGNKGGKGAEVMKNVSKSLKELKDSRKQDPPAGGN